MEWLHMTAKEYREAVTKKRSASTGCNAVTGKNKYNAQKTVINGVQFDSLKEARIYQNLLNLQNKGIITHLERQKRFEIIPKTKTDRSLKVCILQDPINTSNLVRKDCCSW